MEGKLDRKKLAQAVGGSTQEMNELKAAIFGNPRLKSIWDQYMEESGSEFEATACTVTEALKLGFTASGGSGPNIYDSELPHEEVLRRLNQYPNW